MGLLSYVFATLFIQLLIISQKGCLCTISCFTCTSRNGSNVDCEDPFHPVNLTYSERCKVPKRDHKGEFPAHFCIKVIGTSYTTKQKLTVRRCVIENMDSQCGNFRLESDVFHGCILTCDVDGCNSSSYVSLSHILLVPTMILLVGICLPLFSPQTEPTSHRRHLVRQSNHYNYELRESRRTSCAMKSIANPLNDMEVLPPFQDISIQLKRNVYRSISRISPVRSRMSHKSYL